MMHPIEIDEFLELSQQLTVLDVRSEKEFAEGHFPGAVNIPMSRKESWLGPSTNTMDVSPLFIKDLS
jgi:rhodanese-related sulfurtransferase